MKKTISIFFLVACIALNYTEAQIVTLNNARTVARNFLFEKSGVSESVPEELSIRDVVLRKRNGMTAYYIVRFSPRGFVIVAGNQHVFPVLGYSRNSFITENELPPALDSWLDNFAGQIALAWESNLPAKKSTEKLWKHYLDPNFAVSFHPSRSGGIDPLIRSLWHQGANYNSFCPEDPAGPGGHTFAGCVAVALAQIMFYHRHPEHGMGSHSYYHSQYDTILADFSSTEYRWEEMVNCIHDKPNPAIAELIFHAGVSTEMNYSPSGSGAYTESCVDALKDYFQYDTSLRYRYRADTSLDWKALLIENLENLMPVLYRGGSFASHSFICDGYADTSFFHFNFGWWNGGGNGYYYLDNLTPFGYNFTSQQAAIFDIFPDGEYPQYASGCDTLTAERGTFEDGSGCLHYRNNTDAYWLINPDSNAEDYIMLYFDVFDTESNNDILTIYDGQSTTAPILGSFSGDELPPVLISTSNSMLLHFHTNDAISKQGWFAHYVTVHDQFCQGWKEIKDTVGWIQDGSGIIYDYTNNTDCKWLINPQVPAYDSIAGIIITLQEFLSVEGEDLLKIYDGMAQSDPLIAEITGDAANQQVVSTSNKVLLNFLTDGQNTDAGFSLHFQSYYPEYCTDTALLVGATGTFSDGSGNKNYIKNTDCYWLIQPPGAKEIILTFTEFDLEFGYDWLKVFDPSINPPQELGHFTGDDLPPDITSGSGSMLIHFHSDYAINDKGWEASYTISNLDIDENYLDQFSLKPNPATDHISTEIPGSNPIYKYLVFDTCGKAVLSGQTGRGDIDISSLKPGLYILKLYNKDETGAFRFIKK